eukprot:GHVT01093813.1.p1 GENE.GHVT01093813.1~~GHVT01093813.1.p1  ORF type:complete len:132 (-),score=41.20 GHVT01093813.1:274-669(-)
MNGGSEEQQGEEPQARGADELQQVNLQLASASSPTPLLDFSAPSSSYEPSAAAGAPDIDFQLAMQLQQEDDWNAVELDEELARSLDHQQAIALPDEPVDGEAIQNFEMCHCFFALIAAAFSSPNLSVGLAH